MNEKNFLKKFILPTVCAFLLFLAAFFIAEKNDLILKNGFPANKDLVNVRKLTMINNSFSGAVEIYEVKTHDGYTCFVGVSTIPNNPAMAINLQCK